MKPFITLVLISLVSTISNQALSSQQQDHSIAVFSHEPSGKSLVMLQGFRPNGGNSVPIFLWGDTDELEEESAKLQELKIEGNRIQTDIDRIEAFLLPHRDAPQRHRYSERVAMEILEPNSSNKESLKGVVNILGFINFSVMNLFIFEPEKDDQEDEQGEANWTVKLGSPLSGEIFEFTTDSQYSDNTELANKIARAYWQAKNPEIPLPEDQQDLSSEIDIQPWPTLKLSLWGAFVAKDSDTSMIFFRNRTEWAVGYGYYVYYLRGDKFSLLDPERVLPFHATDEIEDSVRPFDRIKDSGEMVLTSKLYLLNFSLPLGPAGSPIMVHTHANPEWFRPELLEPAYYDVMEYEEGFAKASSISPEGRDSNGNLLRLAVTNTVLPEWWLQQVEDGVALLQSQRSVPEQKQVRLEDLLFSKDYSKYHSATRELLGSGLLGEDYDIPQKLIDFSSDSTR